MVGDVRPQKRRVLSTLSVCDSGTGFIAQPCLWIVLGQWLNVRVLHDHARTSVPSQNRVVVSRRGKIHGPLVVTHCIPQSVICGSTSPRIAMTNAGISQTLPDDAGVVGLLVVSFEFERELPGLLSAARWSGIDRSAQGAGKSVPAGDRARWPERQGKCFPQEQVHSEACNAPPLRALRGYFVLKWT